jgi:hypothetical protein
MANISQITDRDSCEIHKPSIIFHIPVKRRNCITDILYSAVNLNNFLQGEKKSSGSQLASGSRQLTGGTSSSRKLSAGGDPAIVGGPLVGIN